MSISKQKQQQQPGDTYGLSMDSHNALTISYAGVNVHSSSETKTPNFVFPALPSAQGAVSLFRCKDVSGACIIMKEFLLVSFSEEPSLSCPGILRMDCLDLHLLPAHSNEATRGWMLLHEDAALLDADPRKNVTIAAILVPGDPRVRWFYSLLSISTLLSELLSRQIVDFHSSWPPGSFHQSRFATYIHQSFLAAITIPHDSDYLNALELTDCCPDIIDPDDALKRLQGNEFLYFSHKNALDFGTDLGDDRYLLELHPAEREAASIANLKCAEYLLVKRTFFKSFLLDIYRSDLTKIDPNASSTTRTRTASRTANTSSARQGSEVPTSAIAAATPNPTRNEGSESPVPRPGSVRRGGGGEGWSDHRKRVRTEHAHQQWLESAHHFSRSRAQILVVCWRELGFLDEGRYLDTVKEGGMLESIGSRLEEDREQDGANDGAAPNATSGLPLPAPLAARRHMLDR